MKVKLTRQKTNFKQFAKHIFKGTNYFLLATGVIIIAFASRIEDVLHWVVGSATIVVGAAYFVKGLRDYGNKNSTSRLSVASVLIVLGIVILSQRENAVGTIMIIWGFIGLARGSFVIFGFVKHHEDVVVFDLVELIITVIDAALAVTLLCNPYQQVLLHIRILGVAILLMSFKTIRIPGANNDCATEIAKPISIENEEIKSNDLLVSNNDDRKI